MKRSPKAARAMMYVLEDYPDDAEDMMGETDCPDGCYVEPDGECSHGYESAALTLGII